MASSARKIVIELQGKYTAASAFQQLSRDLKSLDNIKALRDALDKFGRLRRALEDARAKAADLKRAMQDGGDATAYEQARAEVRRLASEMVRERDAIVGLRGALAKAEIDTNDLAAAQNRLHDATQAQARVFAAMRALGVQPFKKLQEEIDKTELALKDLKASGKLTFREMAVAEDRARQRIAAIREQMNGWSSHLTRIQQGWAGLLGVFASARAATGIVRLFAGFDDIMRQVGAVSGASADQFERMVDLAKRMGRETPYSARQAGEALLFLARAGFGAEKSMQALPAVLRLASATSTDLGRAADIVTNIMSGFQIQAEDLAAVNDILVAATNSSNSTLEELGAAFSYVGPIAKAAGQDFTTVAAVLAKMHDAGIKGERAGTALRGALSRLARPTRMVKQAIADLGLEVKDSSGNIRPFIDILADLEKKGAGVTELVKLFGQEAGPGIAGLLGMGVDALRKYDESLRDVEGTAERIAVEKEKGIGGALRELRSAAEGLGIAIGDTMAPAVLAAAKALATLARIATKVPGVVWVIASAAGGIVTALAAWQLGIKHLLAAMKLANVEMTAWLLEKAPAATTNLLRLASASTVMGFAARGLAAAMAAAAGYMLGEWLQEKAGLDTVESMTREAAKAEKELGIIRGRTAQKLAKISNETGVAVRTMAEFNRAVREGRIVWDEAARTWRRGIGALTGGQKEAAAAVAATADQLEKFEAAARKAYEAASAKADEYARKVRDLDGRIRDQRQATEDLVRSLGRKGMSAEADWADRQREAVEKLAAARKAMAEGDYKRAEALARRARDLYAGLAQEIKKTGKDGEAVVVKTLAETKRTAIEGVRAVGALLDELYTRQRDEAEKQRRIWAEMADGIRARLDEITADRQARIEISLERLREAEDAIERLTRDATKRIFVRTIEKKAAGGAVGLQSGGRLPGYGGGDRISALLEAGEFVIRKEAVARYGAGLFAALNAMRLDIGDRIRARLGGLVAGLPEIQAPAMFAAGGPVAAGAGGGEITVNLTLPGAAAPARLRTDSMTAERLLRDLDRMRRLASR